MYISVSYRYFHETQQYFNKITGITPALINLLHATYWIDWLRALALQPPQPKRSVLYSYIILEESTVLQIICTCLEVIWGKYCVFFHATAITLHAAFAFLLGSSMVGLAIKGWSVCVFEVSLNPLLLSCHVSECLLNLQLHMPRQKTCIMCKENGTVLFYSERCF
jgi:hypothetical protein